MKAYLILIILFPLIGLAQPYETNPDYKRANIWHFGYGAGIDFNSGTPVSISGGQTNHTIESFSSLCDTMGNLLFYSDGINIWNKNHTLIENGTDLLGQISSTQGCLILQHPRNDSLIYVFTTPQIPNMSIGLHYSVINRYLNNGDGKVVLKNKLLLTPTTEKLAAVNHGNGHDVWILAHGYTTNSYFSFLLTKNGVIECPIESKTGNLLEGIPALWFSNAAGSLVPSNDGSKILSSLANLGKVEDLSFNNNTGEIKLIKSFYLQNLVYCTAFSSNTDKYFAQSVSNDSSYIYAINNDSISLLLKNHKRGIQYINQIGDNIYIANMDSNFVSNIKNINTTPTYIDRAIDITPNISSAGLCNFNKSYNYTPSITFTFEIDCINNTVQFNGKDTFFANSHDWLFEKQGLSITESSKEPFINFNDTGTYMVRYIASNGIRSDTVAKTINILPKIKKNFLGSDTGWCSKVGDPITINAPSGMHCYEWSNGSNSSFINVSDTGTYGVKITTSNFCVIYDTIKVFLDTMPNISSDFLGSDLNWCENLDSSTTLNAPNGFRYLWSNGDTAQQINISKFGDYWVTITTTYNCFYSDTISLIKDTLPNLPFNFLGNDMSWCENLDTFATISAPSGFSYIWNTGDTTQQIIAHQEGQYWVVLTADNNCKIKDTINVSLDTLPNLPINFLGDDISWCENFDTSATISAPSGFRYIWNTSDTTQQIVAHQEGQYWVALTASNNCVVSDTIIISLWEAPLKPHISRSNDTIFYLNHTNEVFYWFKDDILLSDTTTSIKLTQNGIYQIKGINNNHCINYSDTLVVANLSINNTFSNQPINIYPNPFSEQLIITNETGRELKIKIMTIEGKIVASKTVSNSIEEMDTKYWNNGIYLIHILTKEGKNITHKLIKQSP